MRSLPIIATALLAATAPAFAMADPRVEVIRDVPYTRGGVKARLDIYRPREATTEGGTRGAPVLIQVHGGAWTIGQKEQQGLLLMNRMAARGWICVSVNYRLAPKYRWPTQIGDVRNAITWVHDHIGEYGGDANHLVLTGGSAGGHLASLAALTSLVMIVPGLLSARRAAAAMVMITGRPRTQKTCRRFQLAFAALGLALALLPVV